MTCIREHVTIDEAGTLLEANAERHLKSPREMARLFRRAPEAIDRTLRFLDRCNFSLEELMKTEYPDENREGFANPQEALVALVEAGYKKRYPNGARAERSRRARQGAEDHLRASLRAVFPHRPRHRPLRALQRHPVPGARLGCELRDLLLPGDHRGRSREGRSAVRAFRRRGTQGAARHRRRLRARAPRRGDPAHLQQIRPPSREPCGDRHLLSRAQRDPRSRQGVRAVGRHRRRARRHAVGLVAIAA